MTQTLKSLAIVLVAVCFIEGTTFNANANDGEEVSITGVLKVLKKKSGGKVQTTPYIQNGDSKTILKLEIANKEQRPNLKKYLKKRIVIKGFGKQKMVKDKAVLVLTKVTSIEKVASTEPAETSGKGTRGGEPEEEPALEIVE